MTRPRHDLSEVMRVRLSGSERDAFLAAAKRLGESRSNLLRRAVREIINRPADLLERELVGLDEAVYQLRAIGRNLNQVTRAIHLGELKDAQLNGALIESLQQAVDQLASRVTELAEKSRLRRVFR
jgi:metal-responsive CopG/Arc/MetJ family transcriptional regulator